VQDQQHLTAKCIFITAMSYNMHIYRTNIWFTTCIHTATHCNTLQQMYVVRYVFMSLRYTHTYHLRHTNHNSLQHTATHCNKCMLFDMYSRHCDTHTHHLCHTNYTDHTSPLPYTMHTRHCNMHTYHCYMHTYYVHHT